MYRDIVSGEAARKALQRADLTLDDIKVIEINEASASVPPVSTLLLADRDPRKADTIRAKTNVSGGAITIGHLNTASRARIIMDLMYGLRSLGGRFPLGGICGGLARGDASIIRVA